MNVLQDNLSEKDVEDFISLCYIQGMLRKEKNTQYLSDSKTPSIVNVLFYLSLRKIVANQNYDSVD